MSTTKSIPSRETLRPPRFTTSSYLIGACAIALGCLTLAVIGLSIGAVYESFAYGRIGVLALHSGAAGVTIGLLYAVPFLAKRSYTIPGYLRGAHRPSRIFYAWNVAFVALLVLAFLTQTTIAVSRVTAVVFYGAGLLAMLALQGTVRRAIVAGLKSGRVPPRRIMLVGHKGSISGVSRRLATAVSEDERLGVRVVAVTQLPPKDGPGDLAGDLAHAVGMARALLPDEIVIAASWNDDVTIDAAVRAFEQLPVAIHIDSGPVLARFSALHLRRVGNISTVSVAELPLTPGAVIVKRVFDIIGAAIALILLSPVFALAALLIKWDSPGPVMFRQERRGFNLDTFSIIKFRTMSVAPAPEDFEQAKPGDARITRVGRLLRRTSIDELPQLLNVLIGDMSLVGPRPHAVDHDRTFENRIRRYPRRLNMKPGITGWAQVNGLRGLTDTDEKMQHRVEADLYYIDNWSILFDVYILVLTVLSPKTFNNAG